MRVQLQNWWPNFDFNSDYLIKKVLRNKFNAKIVKDKPDLILYSVFGWDEKKSWLRRKKILPNWDEKIPKVCYSGERLSDEIIEEILDRGDFLIYSKRLDHPRYLRLTETEKNGWYDINPKEYISAPATNKTKFCSFIYYSKRKHRESFCKELMKYKTIDCLGKSLNNATSQNLSPRHSIQNPGLSTIGISNIEVLKKYKFNIAYENVPQCGYLTEKIWLGFLARTINIYYGDPTVHESFNKGSFLCRDDFKSDKQLINTIKELDNDTNAYNEMLNKWPVRDEQMLNESYLINFISSIILGKI